MNHQTSLEVRHTIDGRQRAMAPTTLAMRGASDASGALAPTVRFTEIATSMATPSAVTLTLESALRLALGIALAVALTAPAPVMAQDGDWTLVGWNDLGMHCMDADYSVFSILPPYNTIHAQLLDPSGDLVTSASGITVTYEAVADPEGSINSTSIGKTGFWDRVLDLFGVSLSPDQGLAGSNMPGPANTPQPMHFEPAFSWFTAEGIPLTPYDNSLQKRYYPMMRLVARGSGGQVLATTRIVLPVSDEMTCISCHGSGSGGAAEPSAGWIDDPDPERDFRLNILRLHDELQATSASYAAALVDAGYSPAGLFATVTAGSTPVLCDACHGSNALPGTGLPGVTPLTAAVHARHASVIDPRNGMTLNQSANRAACYTCHPGSETRCLRGAMGNAVASDGSLEMQCQSCHGSMQRVGALARDGWFDEPTCQSCHTGTATQNNGQIRFTSAFDSSGEPRVAVNSTFATDPGTPFPGTSLYRFSTGHGGVQCSGCHGSTHAIFPSSHLNDNLQNLDLQGHAGTLSDCAACHSRQPETFTGGPHGMHPIGPEWIDHHTDPASSNRSQCRTCHGTDYRGTVLSRALGDRTFSTELGQKHFWKGFQIGCYTCHNGPSDDDRTSNHAPNVLDASATTAPGVPVGLQLTATDPDGDALQLRVVTQPRLGTVGLVGRLATYYPPASLPPGLGAPEEFTFAAWDGSTDSNLGNAIIVLSQPGPCAVTCNASAPSLADVGTPVQLVGDASTDCSATLEYSWELGGGTTAVGAVISHAYASPGAYQWTLTVTAGTEWCSRTGTITVVQPAQCSLTCRAEVPRETVVNRIVELRGAADGQDCSGAAVYEWSFGDGGPGGRGRGVRHRYTSTGTYSWMLRVTRDGAICEVSGSITVKPRNFRLEPGDSLPLSGTALRLIATGDE